MSTDHNGFNLGEFCDNIKPSSIWLSILFMFQLISIITIRNSRQQETEFININNIM